MPILLTIFTFCITIFIVLILLAPFIGFLITASLFVKVKLNKRGLK